MKLTRNLFADSKEEGAMLKQALIDEGYKHIRETEMCDTYVKKSGDTYYTEVLWKMYLMNQ